MSDVDFICRLVVLPAAFVIDPVAPIVVLAWCLRLHLVTDPYFLQPAFSNFSSDGFLVLSTFAYVVHALGDKVPGLAHLMDVVGVVLRPLAVAFVGLWMANRLDPQSTLHWAALAIVLLAGVPAAFGMQALRTKVRLGASLASFGGAHPMISTAETAAGAGLAYLAVVHPLAAATVLALIGLPLIWLSYLAVRMMARTAQAGLRRFGRTSAGAANPSELMTGAASVGATKPR